MRNLVLILAIAAMIYGGRRYHQENPHVWKSIRETLQLDRLGGSGESESRKKNESRPSGKAARPIATISSGSRVDTQSHAEASGLTIIEFTADW